MRRLVMGVVLVGAFGGGLTIALVDRDLAIYRSSTGVQVQLERERGPFASRLCV